MDRIPRVAAVNDMSGFGRCSLAVAMPILSAMGNQVCPVPTALLSAHTGYPDPFIRDLSAELTPYLRHWEKLDIAFEAICTGFLGGEAQTEQLVPFLSAHRAKGALCVVDPVMGDHGKLYSSCSPDLVNAMRRLAAYATVITPNLTEACLLTGADYGAVTAATDRIGTLTRIGEELLALGCESAVITGIPEGETVIRTAAVRSGETLYLTDNPRIVPSYAGTGDVFAAVLCGHLLRGKPLCAAVEETAAFVGRVTAHTADRHLPEQDGVVFEPFLGELGRE